MPVPPLEGFALATALDLARATVDGHEVRFYRSALARGELGEAAIVEGWLPGAGWEEVGDEVLLSAGATIAHDGTGHTITLTVADENRTEWADDLAVAVVARHWFPSSLAWGGWYLAAWGYLTGEGRQRLGLSLDQTGERVATYAGYWDKSPTPAMRLGRRNLAQTATIKASTPALATPAAESPLEYLSQDDCAPGKAIDGNADTVAVLDAIADPEALPIGDMPYPTIIRCYGPRARGVAVGGEPRFIEVAFRHDVAPWGTFDNPAAVPFLHQQGSNVRDDAQVISTIAAGRYIVRALAQGFATTNGVTWQIPTGAASVPARVVFTAKAGSTDSIGRTLFFTYQLYGQAVSSPAIITLTGQFAEYTFDIDDVGAGAFVEVRFQSGRGETIASDMWFEIGELHVYTGYDDLAYATDHEYKKLFLCWDNGAGVERNQRVAFGLIPGEQWRIPPGGSVVFCDDIPTFKARFGDTGKTLFQMKADNSAWYFGPGAGRVKLAYANNPSLTDYDDPQLVLAGPLAEVSFHNLDWLPSQAISRNDAPVGTSPLSREDYPHLGLLPGATGGGYWWLDLGAYNAPRLARPMTPGDDRVPVDDPDHYTEHGFGYADDERIWWVGKDEGGLIVRERGVGGTGIVGHGAGVAFVPEGFGGVYQNNGTRQFGHNVDLIELRRKPGTPIILAGAVLTSNQLAPGDPSEGGARWEHHPDWQLVQRFAAEDRQGNLDVVTMNLAALYGGPREVRHVCVQIAQMARVNGEPQRAKLNEIVVRQATLGAGQAGGWASREASDVGGVIGYLLRRHAGMPPGKVALAAGASGQPLATPPIGDLPIAPTNVRQALSTVAAQALLAVRLDPQNAATIEADPASPLYTATAPYWTWASDNAIGDLTLAWAGAHQVAQVRASAREVAQLRTHSASYPARRARLGEVVEVRDLLARTALDVTAAAEARYRQGNARRRLSVTAGALPWLRAGQRHLLRLPELDAGGNAVGVNFVVGSYAIRIGIDDGGATWETGVELGELAL